MKLLLTAFVCFITIAVSAQHYNFINYTVEDGLAQSQVRAICQDEHGYLWVGTTTGLSRFDGIEFVNYSTDDGLPDNQIRKLYISKSKDLWVATPKGIAQIHNQKITSLFFEEEYRVNGIAELKEEIYFASNTGLIKIKDNSFIPLGDENEQDYYIRSIVNYKDSILICGTKDGIYTWDGEKFDELKIPGYEKFSVKEVKIFENKLYVAAREIGLFAYNMDTYDIKKYDLEYTTLLSIAISDNSIFGITSSSVAFLTKNENTTYFSNFGGVLEVRLQCVFKDLEGNIWIGTDGNGLFKFSGNSVVSYTTESGLGSNLVLSILQDKNGNYIFGSYDEGITFFYDQNKTHLKRADGEIIDNTVWSLMTDSLNHIWIGTSRGLSIIDKDRKAIPHPLEGYRTKIRSIITDKNNFYLGTKEGLIIVNKDSIIVDSHKELNINKLLKLHNNLYCACIDGLYVFENDNYQTYKKIDLPVEKIQTLSSDFQNNLWVGTENGLFVIFKNKTIYPFQLDETDYRSKNILGIITSKKGDIWVSTMNGVYQIIYTENGENKYTIHNYGRAEGLIDRETNINALYEDDNGEIWVGTASGVAKINPKLSADLFAYKIPQVHITGIRLFMEDFNYSAYETELDSIFNIPTKIELPYNKNHLTFDFIGINLKDPKAVKYQYRLLGGGNEWSPISTSNYASYSFLQPGTYTFQVRAMNKNKEWSESEEIQFIILPPFWKTWWFISLIILGAGIIIAYFFQSRIKVLKQKQNNEQLELKNRLLFLEQRSLNASMNRHFIFNSLNSIQYFINSSDKRSANRFLSNFAKLIRKNLDSSAANNFIVTLQEEIERIELYLSLEKMRFSDKFNYTVDVSSSIDTESLEIPSMILQPFVENSIIHGVLSLDRMGEVTVKIYQEFGEIVFEVMDNGVGIDISLKSKKQSVSGDHESKGMEITNRRIELLRKLTGEHLLIVGPFQVNDENGNSLGTKVILKLGGKEMFEE